MSVANVTADNPIEAFQKLDTFIRKCCGKGCPVFCNDPCGVITNTYLDAAGHPTPINNLLFMGTEISITSLESFDIDANLNPNNYGPPTGCGAVPMPIYITDLSVYDNPISDGRAMYARYNPFPFYFPVYPLYSDHSYTVQDSTIQPNGLNLASVSLRVMLCQGDTVNIDGAMPYLWPPIYSSEDTPPSPHLYLLVRYYTTAADGQVWACEKQMGISHPITGGVFRCEGKTLGSNATLTFELPGLLIVFHWRIYDRSVINFYTLP